MIVQKEIHHACERGEDSPELENGIDQWSDVSLVINRHEREYRAPTDEKDAGHKDHMFQQRSITTIARRLSTTMHIRLRCIIVRLNATR